MSDEPTEVLETEANDTESQEQQVFDADYVRKLRQELASNRIELRDFKQSQAEQSTAQKKANEAKLAEQQKWQELATQREAELTELSTYRDRYEAMLQTVKVANERRIEAIPEAMRSIVPEYDDPVKLQNWLEANSSKLAKPAAAELDGGAGRASRNGSSGQTTPEQIKEMAAIYGVDYKAMAQSLGVALGG